MKYTEAKQGRIFVLKLEDGDRLPDTVEEFARVHDVRRAVCTLVGGAGPGALITGPQDGRAQEVRPMISQAPDFYEAAAVGTIFPGPDDQPILHMHASLGRAGHTLTGCVRAGLDIWLTGELVIWELTDLDWRRAPDPVTNLVVLQSA